MAATTHLFTPFVASVASSASPNFSTASLKVLLLTSSWSPDASLTYRSSLTAEVAAGNGYTSGGNALSGVTVGAQTGFEYVDATDLTFTALNRVFRYAVIYQNVGSAATDVLLAYIDFGADQTPAGGDFVIQWATPANGAMLKIASA